MDFFADGGFQQLFCDLNEQLEQDYNLYSHQTLNEKSSAFWSKQESNTPTSSSYANYLDCGSPQLMDLDLNEKQLQHNLNYLLSGNNNSLDIHDNNDLISISSLKQDLADWEYKFLDNYIEIPELVDFLPEKTPLCNDNCNHFLQESAENLKLFPSTPNSPSSPSSISSSSMSAMQMEKSYPCTFGDCCKIYAKPAHLKAHLRRHMGEKPYICNWPNCSWRFSRSDELARHRRSHSGVKPYKCDFCGKCFARSDHLTKHRKVHERRLLAASKAGKTLANGELPASVLTVRPGRKRKNQFQ